MQIESADIDFINQKLPSVQGWLLDPAALLTCGLVRMQASAATAGGIFEIGVFAGKYLSLLYHLTESTGEPVVGLDTFQWYPQAEVEANFARVFASPARLSLVASDSALMTPADVMARTQGKPRFISVDGAHTAPAVHHDLNLSEQILADGGVVAIDDFLNSRAIGVGEGVYRYFFDRGDQGLAPFAYCGNKLFASHRRDLPRLRDAVWRFTEVNPDLAVVAEFRKLLEKGRDWVEQELLGLPVIIL
jgi:hypothetical protein